MFFLDSENVGMGENDPPRKNIISIEWEGEINSSGGIPPITPKEYPCSL